MINELSSYWLVLWLCPLSLRNWEKNHWLSDRWLPSRPHDVVGLFWSTLKTAFYTSEDLASVTLYSTILHITTILSCAGLYHRCEKGKRVTWKYTMVKAYMFNLLYKAHPFFKRFSKYSIMRFYHHLCVDLIRIILLQRNGSSRFYS